jgi:hypothetical protein
MSNQSLSCTQFLLAQINTHNTSIAHVKCHFSIVWWSCRFPGQLKQWCFLWGGRRCIRLHLKQSSTSCTESETVWVPLSVADEQDLVNNSSPLCKNGHQHLTVVSCVQMQTYMSLLGKSVHQSHKANIYIISWQDLLYSEHHNYFHKLSLKLYDQSGTVAEIQCTLYCHLPPHSSNNVMLYMTEYHTACTSRNAGIADAQNSGVKTHVTMLVQFQFHWTQVAQYEPQLFLQVLHEQYIFHAVGSIQTVLMEKFEFTVNVDQTEYAVRPPDDNSIRRWYQ